MRDTAIKKQFLIHTFSEIFIFLKIFLLYGSLRKRWKMFLTENMSWLVEEMYFAWFVIANMIQGLAQDECVK